MRSSIAGAGEPEIAGFDRLSGVVAGPTLRAMRWGWQASGSPDRFAALLAAGVVGAAFIAFAWAPTEAAADAMRWRFDAATSALLIGVAVALRRQPGLAYASLAWASLSLADSIESAWYGPGEPAVGLAALATFARTTVPVAILSLYATAPERRLGRWVVPAAWALTIASVVAVFLRVARETADPTGQSIWPPLNDLSYQLDGFLPVLLIGGIGMLGSLRAAARLHLTSGASVREGGPADDVRAPSGLVLAAVSAAALLWLPATVAYLNRPMSMDAGEDNTRLIFVPILAALVGIVAERWSRWLSWAAVAVAFESIAFLVVFRGAADYVAYALTLPDPGEAQAPLGFLLLLAAGMLIVLFAFAAVSLALRDIWPKAGRAESPESPAALSRLDRRWAVGGAAVGLGLSLWFVGGAIVGSGFPAVLGAGLLPMYAIPVVIGRAGWDRLAKAVAEAESIATAPVRPFRYLETVVLEAATGQARQRRGAVNAERERIASELQAGVLPDLQRLASTTEAGAPREEVAARLRELQDAMRRLLGDGSRIVLEPAYSAAGPRPNPLRTPSDLPRPSRRELEVMRLVADGASNEQIARELFLSLKTVESHLRRLFVRYDVTNRTELAVLAVREGWVDAP